MKKKNRKKKVVRRKRRSMREKRVMQIKRGLMKRAKKLHLGAKRTGAYVYGTLRRIVGNPDHRTRIALQTVRRPMEGYFLGGPDLEESVRFLLQKGYTMAQLKKINPDVEDELSGKKSILPNSRRAFPTPRFVGKGEYVWKKLTPSQKLRFIMESPRGRQSTARSQELFASRGWNFLPRSLKIDLEARFANVESDDLMKNPPMYAHRMMSHRTHGLSLKQMMKLYRLVSSGNPKAVMFARRTLGIPMSESLSQVKAVVYHHVLDLKGKI
jgi:hypothetical protein